MIISTQQQKDKGGPLYKGGPSIFYLEYFRKYVRYVNTEVKFVHMRHCVFTRIW